MIYSFTLLLLVTQWTGFFYFCTCFMTGFECDEYELQEYGQLENSTIQLKKNCQHFTIITPFGKICKSSAKANRETMREQKKCKRYKLIVRLLSTYYKLIIC